MTAARRLAIALVVAVAVSMTIGVLGAVGWPATAYRDGDFTQFWVQPRALIEGGDPYDSAWWAAMHEHIRQRPENAQAVYPPHDAIAFLPFALLPLPYAAAAWIVAQLLAVGAAAAMLALRILQRADRSLFFAVVASFQPVWLLAVGANVTGFLFAAVASAFVAACDRRPLLCGAFLGVLVVKPHPFALVAVALLVRATWPERRRLALGAIATAGPLVAAALALRPAWYAEWLGSAVALAGSPRSNATVWTLDRIAGLPAWSAPVAGVIAIGMLGTWLVRVRPPLATTFAAAIPVSLAVAPYGWSYDQLQLLVPIAVAMSAVGRFAARARTAALVLVALIATALPWALYVLAFQRGGEELSVLAPLFGFALLIGVLRAEPQPYPA